VGCRPETKTTMKQNHDKTRKAAARDRAAATGENYTTALRTVTVHPTGAPGSEVADDVELWVDAQEILEDLGIADLGDEHRAEEIHYWIREKLGNDHEQTRAARDDMWAITFLRQDDMVTYEGALMASLDAVAAERGLRAVHVTPPIGEEAAAGSLAAELVADAIARTILPQLGRAPRDIDGPLSAALTTAGRTYLERIQTEERPDVAARYTALVDQMEQDELPAGSPAVPLESLAAGDVVTLQPLEEDGSISMEPVTDIVQRADEHSVVIGFFGKMTRYNGRLMLASTGDLFDVVDVAKDALARVIEAAAARQGDQ
jgi:hypothetical protein